MNEHSRMLRKSERDLARLRRFNARVRKHLPLRVAVGGRFDDENDRRVEGALVAAFGRTFMAGLHAPPLPGTWCLLVYPVGMRNPDFAYSFVHTNSDEIAAFATLLVAGEMS